MEGLSDEELDRLFKKNSSPLKETAATARFHQKRKKGGSFIRVSSP